MSALPATRKWLVRNVRRLVGHEQVLQALRQQEQLLSRSLADGPGVRTAGGTHDAPASPVTEVLINGDPVLVPNDLMPFIDHCRIPAPEGEIPHILIETPHYAWIRGKLYPGANVLDVGANIGLFSIMMARQVRFGHVGWVHAFEPSPRSRHDLTRMLEVNGVRNVAVRPEAVSQARGKAVFQEIQTGNVTREGSHLSLPGREGGSMLPQADVEVDTIDLDSFVQEQGCNPHLIKIDVEGAEFLVLEGARKCIEQYRPILVIEIHPDAEGRFDHARLRAFLGEHGYVYSHRDKTYYCE